MSTKKPSTRVLPSCFNLHEDHWFLDPAIRAVRAAGPVYCFVSRLAWDGSAGCWERVAEVAEAAGANVIIGDWPDEHLHRSSSLDEMKRLDHGNGQILIPDGDEILEPRLLSTLMKIAQSDLADVVRCSMDTYWRDAAHIIRPREALRPIIMVNARTSQHERIREYSGERVITLGPEYGCLHHLSYAGPPERIERKIATWGHRDEVGRDWFQKVYRGWEADPLIRNLHPTHPQAYGFIERTETPPQLAHLPAWRDEKVEVPENWPKLSTIIPLHGGPEEIGQCLESLAKLQDLIHEIIVVDDASPDEAPEVAASFGFVKLLRNEKNLGFAATCNKGLAASVGENLLSLNSDTIVPRAGLIRLIETLNECGTVGAAGPLSNNVGYHQRVEPTYTSLENLEAFAEDLALSAREDQDVEMLVGHALAFKRQVLKEIGAFDPRYEIGMFEETDLCYRLARAGYRLRLSNRAYVHHWGSRSLQRAVPDVVGLLRKNEALYRKKWQHDLDVGYPSHLPGLGMTEGLVRFNDARHPDKVAREIQRMRKHANISLCMIVRNEERVLRDCLESAKPFFDQIVVVDTGSTDGTVEIARECGAEVHEMTWPDSFAEARNESLKYAKGRWIFWLDGDDTLPFKSGEAILRAALNAPKHIAGHIVPVQFVEEGPGAGTRVDHVKLFRNKPGIQFEGRIHEQILSSLRNFGEIARLDAVVMHSGYDTSTAGQANKRKRDWRLLDLDLADRPNHPFVLFNIGMTHHFSAEHEEAVGWFEKSIANSGDQDSHLRKAWALMGVSLRELGRLVEAEVAFRDGLAKVGEDPELSFQLAMTLVAQGRLAEARAVYEAMPTRIDDHFSSVDIGILTFKRLHNLAGVKHAMGDYLGARADWLEAFRLNPGFVNSLDALVDAAMEKGDYRTAREALDTLLPATGPTPEWVEQRARLAEESGELGGGIAFIDRLIQERPDATGPRLVLARQLLKNQQVEAALPHLQILERQGVAEAAFFLGVACLQRGDAGSALQFTERAVLLNPDHAPSREQLEKLRAMLDRPLPSVLSPEEQRELLTSPHAGKLGPATKRFSVIIVTYNSAEWIEGCLGSVLPTLGEKGEVIVVDNASTDNTLRLVRKLKHPQIRIIANRENLGYAAAANIGILKSKGEGIALLNPDTTVTPGWLEELGKNLDDEVGAVGPVSDAVTGQQFVGHYLKPGQAPKAEQLGEVMKRDFSHRTVDTKFIVGVCVMLHRNTLDRHGLLDENLFLGADDLELSWRLRALGLQLIVALDVFVHHEGHASFRTRPEAETSNLIAASDAALVAKLHRFYGPVLPTSAQLWGSPIFDAAMEKEEKPEC